MTSRFGNPGARKLLVVPRMSMAKCYMQAFELNPEEWRVVSYESCVLGSIFDKIVVVDMIDRYDEKELKRYVEMTDRLRCRLTHPSELYTL